MRVSLRVSKLYSVLSAVDSLDCQLDVITFGSIYYIIGVGCHELSLKNYFPLKLRCVN